MSPLRWTCKSTRQLAGALPRAGHRVGSSDGGRRCSIRPATACRRRPRRWKAASIPTGMPSSSYLNDQVKAFLAAGQPVVSVDAKKKELVGAFKNGGREWQPQGQPEPVNVHDFPGQAAGQGDPVRHLRCGPQRRLGDRRAGPRHGELRGGEPPPLVAGSRGRRLSRGRAAADLRRRRGQQRLPGPALEGRAAAASPTRPAWR